MDRRPGRDIREYLEFAKGRQGQGAAKSTEPGLTRSHRQRIGLVQHMSPLEKLLLILRDNAWNGVAALVAIAGGLYGVFRFMSRQPIRPKWFNALGTWLRLNARGLIQAMLTLTAATAAIALTASYWPALIIILYALILWGLARVTRALGPDPKRRFRTIPIDQVGNAYLHDIYADPPKAGLMLNGVPFSITDVRYDTSRDPGSRRATIIDLQPSIRRPIAAHFLVNAGGAQSSHRGRTLGRLRFRFTDDTSMTEELVLGKNIREWAIGNASPGLLVTNVDPTSAVKIAWSGRNVSGNDAIMDCLTIFLQKGQRKPPLHQIEVVRDVGPGATRDNLGFFVSAITIEHT